jgi:hypothetical protein
MRARRSVPVVLAGLLAGFLWCQGAPAASRSGALPGTYVNDIGTVTIKKTASGFDVEILTAEPTRGVWTCDFGGSGKLDAGGALVVVYTPEAGRDTATVKLTLTLNRDILTVAETRSADIVDFCGYRGFLHGDYRRKARR